MAREVGKGRYQKAKQSRTVDISQTQWKKGMGGPKGEAGRLVGPAGKLFTGTVKMQDGSKVVYEKGKRVTRQATAGGGVTKAQANKKREAASTPKPSAGAKPKQALSSTERKKMQEGRKNWQSGARRTGQDALSAAERKKLQERMRGNKSTVTIPGGTTITLSGQGGSSKKGPKKGDRRRVSPFSTKMEVFNGTRWVKE